MKNIEARKKDRANRKAEERGTVNNDETRPLVHHKNLPAMLAAANVIDENVINEQNGTLSRKSGFKGSNANAASADNSGVTEIKRQGAQPDGKTAEEIAGAPGANDADKPAVPKTKAEKEAAKAAEASGQVWKPNS